MNVGLDQKSRTIEITKYGSRFWSVLVDGRLLCVTVYRKGALAVRDALLNGVSKAGQAGSLPDSERGETQENIQTRLLHFRLEQDRQPIPPV